MKIVWLLVLSSLLAGCVTSNPCAGRGVAIPPPASESVR